MLWLWLAYGIWNAVVFAVYGIDKLKAVRGTWRISEICLILLAALGGGVGGALGMIIFRHKIRKPKFIAVYVLAAIELAAVIAVSCCVL